MEMGWLEKAIRGLFYWIDRGVYSIVEGAYNIIEDLSATTILNQETVEAFATRIYVLIGLFMLFKVAFSLISMFLNPDSFSDSKNGGGKLLQRIVVSLLVLAFVPTIFQWAFRLQAIIVNGNILPNIVLGGSANPEETGQIRGNAGYLISTSVFKSFFIPDGTRYKDENSTLSEEEIAVYDDSLGLTSDIAAFEPLIYSGDNNRFYFDYKILISTAAGIFVAWIMIMFCFDIAVRSIKLSFLQLIAPVPILSYVDNKKGEKIFSKWVENCVSTYLDLFVRLLAIYFVVFVLSELVVNSGLFQYDASGTLQEANASLWVRLFIILGLLLFAKEAPQLLYDILGIKGPKGGFTLNPMRKLQQVPVAGWAATQAIGRTRGAYEAAVNDDTGHPWRTAVGGWFAAGESLKGKVSVTGNDAKAANVNSWKIGREVGFKYATGREFHRATFFDRYARPRAQEDINQLKAQKKAYSSQLNDLQFEQQSVQDTYNNLFTQYNNETDPVKKQKLKQDLELQREYYVKLSSNIKTVQDRIGTLDDQIKDIQRRYTIDKSPREDLAKINTEMNIEENIDVNKKVTYKATPTNQRDYTKVMNEKPSVSANVSQNHNNSQNHESSRSDQGRSGK